MIKSGRALRLGRLFKGRRDAALPRPLGPYRHRRTVYRCARIRCAAGHPRRQRRRRHRRAQRSSAAAPALRLCPACRGRPSQRIDQIRRRSDVQVPGGGGRRLFAQRSRRRERSRQCRLAYRRPAAPGHGWRGGCLRPRRPSAVGDALSARPRDQGSSAAGNAAARGCRWPSTSARISSSSRFRARSRQ